MNPIGPYAPWTKARPRPDTVNRHTLHHHVAKSCEGHDVIAVCGARVHISRTVGPNPSPDTNVCCNCDIAQGLT